MKIYSTSTLSKMNLIQLYHNARDSHSSTNVYVPVPNVLRLVPTHTVFSFFLASCEHDVATERADKSWFLSALIIPASTCFLRKSTDSCCCAFFEFTTSISCNLTLQFNEISAFFLPELILLYLCEANKQLLRRSPDMVNSLTGPLWHNSLLLHVVINGQLVNWKSHLTKLWLYEKTKTALQICQKFSNSGRTYFPRKTSSLSFLGS